MHLFAFEILITFKFSKLFSFHSKKFIGKTCAHIQFEDVQLADQSFNIWGASWYFVGCIVFWKESVLLIELLIVSHDLQLLRYLSQFLLESL